MLPIAYLRTCYPEKFGIPRQSGLAPAAWGVVELTPEYRRPEAVRGLEDFSHLWLITEFHLIESTAAAKVLTVRPPRAGGNERRGVFATRSPFRPNRIGLTVARLGRIEWDHERGPRIWVTGIDLADGTPVLDIKPYVPYADAIPEATSGFAAMPPERVAVTWDTHERPPEHVRQLIEQSLSLQPRPAYQDNPERLYATEMAGWHLRWQSTDEGIRIIECQPLSESANSNSETKP